MPRRIAIAGLVLCALAPAATAQAATPVKVSKAKFALTVDGVQRTTWSTDHKADGIGGCDAPYTASGTEKVRFTSSALSVRALSLPNLNAPVLSVGKGMRTRGPSCGSAGA